MDPIAETQLQDIHDHALKEYPFECCGIIIGKTDSHENDILFRCKNIQDQLHKKEPDIFVRDSTTAFYIDPKELMKIFKEADEKEMVAKVFYHSHPEHDAYFSEEDKRMALFDGEPLYPHACYLVVSVYDHKIKDEALFSWNPDSASFEKR